MTDGSTASRPTFEQFTALRRYQPALAFSPDGSEIAYSVNTSGQFNLWRQASGGGYPHQLTVFSDRAVRDIAWSANGASILFTADHHGDEQHQLFLIPARGGQPQPLTDTPNAQHSLGIGAVSRDGRRVAYAGNDRSPADQDVLVRDLATGEVRRVLAAGGYLFNAGWSPDGTQLLVLDFHSNTSQDVQLLDLATGEATLLTTRDADVRNFPGPWLPDGSGFFLISDEDREQPGLAFFDVGANARRWIATPDWEVEQVALSPDGRYLAWAVNEDGYSRLHARDLTTGADVTLPLVPDGVIHTLVAGAGGTLGLLLDRAIHPSEVFVIDIPAGTTTQLTHGFLGGIDAADLVAPELIGYPTHDGREIPAFLYQPRGAGPFPVILSIHGGPEYQERPSFLYSGLYQYLLSRGIGILAPNVRGSTGYGKTYQTLIHRDWGGAELGDFEMAVRWLQRQPWVRADRIGVFGGSFGGFATLSCVSRLPELFAAAVDVVGPSNLVTFARAVPPTWRRLMAQWVGDPETEAEFLLSRSPVTYVDQIRAPLFVIQGATDPRVVKAESDQIVARLRERGVTVRYDVYEDEGHGFTRRENELRAYRDIAGFFEETLLGE